MRKPPRGRAVLQGELQIKRFVQRREAIQVYGFTRAAVAQDSFEPAANIPRRWCAMMINYSIDHQVLLRRLSWTTALLWGHQTNAHGTIVQSRRSEWKARAMGIRKQNISNAALDWRFWWSLTIVAELWEKVRWSVCRSVGGWGWWWSSLSAVEKQIGAFDF